MAAAALVSHRPRALGDQFNQTSQSAAPSGGQLSCRVCVRTKTMIDGPPPESNRQHHMQTSNCPSSNFDQPTDQPKPTDDTHTNTHRATMTTGGLSPPPRPRVGSRMMMQAAAAAFGAVAVLGCLASPASAQAGAKFAAPNRCVGRGLWRVGMVGSLNADVCIFF